MADVVRRATFVLDFASGDAKINQADLDPVARSLKEILEIHVKTTTELKVEIEATQELRRVQEETTVAAKADFRALIDGAQSSTEGILLLTRAMVLFGASEENLASIAAQVAKIQGAIDLLKGSRKLIEGLSLAVDGLTLAFKAGALVLNPWIPILAALAAGLALIKFATEDTTAATEENTRANERSAEGQRRVRREIELTIDAQRNLRRLLGTDSSGNAITTARSAFELDIKPVAGYKRPLPGIAGSLSEVEENQIIEERRLINSAANLTEAITSKSERQLTRAQSEFLAAARADATRDPFEQTFTPDEARTSAALSEAKREAERAALEVAEVIRTVGDTLVLLKEEFQKQQDGALSSQ